MPVPESTAKVIFFIIVVTPSMGKVITNDDTLTDFSTSLSASWRECIQIHEPVSNVVTREPFPGSLMREEWEAEAEMSLTGASSTWTTEIL